MPAAQFSFVLTLGDYIYGFLCVIFLRLREYKLLVSRTVKKLTGTINNWSYDISTDLIFRLQSETLWPHWNSQHSPKCGQITVNINLHVETLSSGFAVRYIVLSVSLETTTIWVLNIMKNEIKQSAIALAIYHTGIPQGRLLHYICVFFSIYMKFLLFLHYKVIFYIEILYRTQHIKQQNGHW